MNSEPKSQVPRSVTPMLVLVLTAASLVTWYLLVNPLTWRTVVNAAAVMLPVFALAVWAIRQMSSTERALRASEETFQTITENISDVVTIHSLDGKLLFLSRSRFADFPFPEGRSDEPFPRALDEDRRSMVLQFQRIIETGEPQRFEWRMPIADGSVRFVESVGTLIRHPDGTPDRILGVSRDVTERRRAEDQLRRQKDFSETLLANLTATSHRLMRQNAALAEQARNPALLDGDLTRGFQAITEIAAHTLDVARASIWFLRSDDRTIRCEDLFTSAAAQHTSGAVLHEERHPRYFYALKEGRVIPAHDARIDLRTSEFAAEYLEPLQIASILDAPVRVGGKLVGIICHEHTGSPRQWTLDEQNFAGSMADLVALNLEVSQRRQAEQALVEANDQLEVKVADRTHELSEANERLKELDRLKSEFLAMMSHELRTPLNSIIGFTGILRQELAGPLNDEQKKQLTMVHFSARHLLSLITDLLDLSRIESGKMEVDYEEFPVEEVVTNVVETLVPAAMEKQLQIRVDQSDPSLGIRCDRKKLFQILLNLVNNAVKFTHKGSVSIAVSASEQQIRFEVSDTGIGIKADQLPRLFEAFRQVDGSARRVYEGTGLGLYLCKKLVNILHGSIGAESEFGTGSRFYFSLPREAPAS